MALALDNFTKVMGGLGNQNIVICDIDFDASYPTGGESISTPATILGMDTVHFAIISPSGGYVFTYDYTNNKILAYRSAGSGAAMAQVPNTTDISAITNVRAMFIGV